MPLAFLRARGIRWAGLPESLPVAVNDIMNICRLVQLDPGELHRLRAFTGGVRVPS